MPPQSDRDRRIVRLRFFDVWAKRGGRWVVVFSQATRAPKS